MSQDFPTQFKSFGRNINVKSGLKNIILIDTPSFAFKKNLASLKTEVHKLDVAKLAPVPVYLSKLIDIVKNDVVKKLFMINWLQK